MSIPEILLLLIQSVHGIVAVVWIGGALFYLLVLVPVFRSQSTDVGTFRLHLSKRFQEVTGICIILLTITGIVLMFDKITSPHTTDSYLATLGLKVGISLIMFTLVWKQRQARRDREKTPPQTTTRISRGISSVFPSRPVMVLCLGVGVFLLSDILGAIFQHTLLGR